jgi:cell division protein FtsQ
VATAASTAAGKRRASSRSGRAAPKGRPASKKGSARRAPARTRRPSAKTSPKRSRAAKPKRKSGQVRSAFAIRRPKLRTVLVGVPLVIVALAVTYFAWFRNSSFVAVSDVRIEGVTTDSERVGAALTDEAQSMTTLNFDASRLEAATRAFPTVAAVDADPDFPSGVVINVKERPPALLVNSGGDLVPVAGDGTVLRGLGLESTAGSLPQIDVDDLGSASTLTGAPLAQAQIAGAAPGPLQPLIEGISYEDDSGVVVTMKGDIPVRFGTGAAASAKWAAAAAVLADPHLETLTYLDVRVPERPSVGGQADSSLPSAGTTVTTP